MRNVSKCRWRYGTSTADERHIRYSDVKEIRKIISTEFNIEGNCREQKFVDLVLEVKPTSGYSCSG